ncbi:MAG TPA: gephyrin-like molybdotransferase Glp [Anaerolineales bacterium]|nr:gephyrin-like molybdotransferase Glp [Anaerolineales bacterium]
MNLLSVHEAQERILSHFQPVETETLSLGASAGRVLAADIVSSDLPHFDNSSVDGFAVVASDLVNATPDSPSTLSVIADIPAGSSSDIAIKQGQAARIMTGAPVPKGADAIVMVEDTDIKHRNPGAQAPATVKVFKSVQTGENIRPRGMDIKTGHKILFTGTRLRAQEVGLLAMLGVANVSLYRKPLIALLSSGDELTAVESRLAPGQIHDSNSYTLSALIGESGCEVLWLGIAPDRKEAIQFLFDQAVGVNADLIISSAGVSVGALDYVKEVVESNGQLDFWRVNMRPGKPLAFGEYRRVPFIGLPGNPVSAFVGFEVFARPAIDRLTGSKTAARLRVKVRLAEAIESDGRESYLRAVIEERAGILSARLTGHQGSGNLLSLVQANALLIVPAGVKSLAIGDQAEAWIL